MSSTTKQKQVTARRELAEHLALEQQVILAELCGHNLTMGHLKAEEGGRPVVGGRREPRPEHQRKSKLMTLKTERGSVSQECRESWKTRRHSP